MLYYNTIGSIINQNARVGLGGTRAFTLIAAARPQSGQRRAGKKEVVFRERNFCPPADFLAEFLPAAEGGGLKVSVGVFLKMSSNFFQQTPH